MHWKTIEAGRGGYRRTRTVSPAACLCGRQPFAVLLPLSSRVLPRRRFDDGAGYGSSSGARPGRLPLVCCIRLGEAIALHARCGPTRCTAPRFRSMRSSYAASAFVPGSRPGTYPSSSQRTISAAHTNPRIATPATYRYEARVGRSSSSVRRLVMGTPGISRRRWGQAVPLGKKAACMRASHSSAHSSASLLNWFVSGVSPRLMLRKNRSMGRDEFGSSDSMLP